MNLFDLTLNIVLLSLGTSSKKLSQTGNEDNHKMEIFRERDYLLRISRYFNSLIVAIIYGLE